MKVMGMPQIYVRLIKASTNTNWRLPLGLVTSLALILTIYTYSAQVTNASYQPSEYLKEPPVTTTGQTGTPFDWIKGLSYLGLITTIGLLLFRYLMTLPWFSTFVKSLKNRL
jgi:hypothetical protein